MVTRVMINPKMMTWAREYAGFIGEYEAELPGYIKKHYESWESGEKFPTWNQLMDVSKKYKVPTAFFFMDPVPTFDELPKLINFRKLDYNNPYKTNSPNLIREIRKAESMRENYLDLLFELEIESPTFKIIEESLDKYSFSNYIRDLLEISVDTQKSWYREKKHYNFLNMWKKVLNEKLGVLIFETEGVNIEEMRALCIFNEKAPIILLNGKDSVNGRIFSLFHELTHLLLGVSAICDDNTDPTEESFCNAVSGEFLVPEETLLKYNVNDLSNNTLTKISNIFGVSIHVILRRLYDSKQITHSEYNNKIDNFNEFVIDDSDDGGGHRFNNVLKYNSEAYCAIVLEAYESGIINSGEFTQFTNLKKKFIPDLQKRVYGGE